MTNTVMPKKIHYGRNIARVRTMLEVKQATLADTLQKLTGEEWNQRSVSYLESKEDITPELLKQVAAALEIPVKAIENFNKETAIEYFNSFTDSVNDNKGSVNIGSTLYDCTFNNLDKEKLEELLAKNENLYLALLKEKDEKFALMQKILHDNK